jgi:hypothetical protein
MKYYTTQKIIIYLTEKKINNCKNDISRAKRRAEEIVNLSSGFANFDIKDIMFNALVNTNILE